MSDPNQPLPEPAAVPPEGPIFYTRNNAKGVQVALWLTHIETPRAPTFKGEVNGTRVSAWLRTGPSGPFIGIHLPEKGAEGNYPRVGSANVVVNERGEIRCVVNLVGKRETDWASVSKTASEALLVQCGLRPELVPRRKAEFAAKQVAELAAAKAAAAVVDADSGPAAPISTPPPVTGASAGALT